MRNRLATLVLLVFMSCSALGADKESVAKAVKEDGMSVQDARKWYTVYKGSYIYVKELDSVGSKDFGDVFVRFRSVRDKVMPTKGNEAFKKATDLSKFADPVANTYADFTAENKTDLAEELYEICEGLKAGMK
jgi:hypothetical protein